MFGKQTIFKNFYLKKTSFKKKEVLKNFKNLIKSKNPILSSLDKRYKDNYNKKFISKFKNSKQFTLIGMGGSILGARAIYNFLNLKLKNFIFIDNLSHNFSKKKPLRKNTNIIISKSGNTLETISNANLFIGKDHKNIFITENKKSYLMNLANKLKSEVVHHNNFIGGRYSVFSEVGMLPAELMGCDPIKFRRLNQIIKNKSYINSLIQNVLNILYLIKKKKFNSIILNYDEKSNDLFHWYQQLVAESLGKKGSGILPVVSTMPKDNHSLMQYYLDGKKNNFFTFFFVKDGNFSKIKNNEIMNSHFYLKNKKMNDILYSQYIATEKVFRKKKIPFRSFVIKKRTEESLAELFAFFIFETILLANAMKINPYDQPSVELIKKETKNILVNS